MRKVQTQSNVHSKMGIGSHRLISVHLIKKKENTDENENEK